jgi:hypothetical protein
VHNFQSRWAPSDAVLCTTLVSRSCSSAQSPASSPSPPTTSSAKPGWFPQSAHDVLHRIKNISKTASANTPEAVKQLAESAKEGKLFRVAAIHSSNLWLRFGGAIVAVAFAGGTYTLYRTSQSLYSAITGIKDDGWTLRVIVRTFIIPSCMQGDTYVQFSPSKCETT